MDILRSIELGLVAAAASIAGSMLGLGGGVFLVPIFTLFFGVGQKYAIAASAVAVATNSVVGSNVHLRSRFTNLRLAMLMLIPTTTGAILGANFGANAPEWIISLIFGSVLTVSGIWMLARSGAASKGVPDAPDPLGLGAVYSDPATKSDVEYVPTRVKTGLGVSAGAGMLSGMLGVGGGIVQVPAMNLMMRVPVKAAAGTSTFMVGVAAVASSFVYYSHAKVDPRVVVPTMIGVFVGGQIGGRLTRRLKAQRLVTVFVLVLIYLGGSLVLKGIGVDLPWQK